MLKLFLIASLAALALARSSFKAPIHDHLLTEEEVSEINTKSKTWTADYNLVKSMTKKQARSKLGTYIDSSDYPEAYPEPFVASVLIPSSFDGRVQWPDCINYIRDQGKCGSCWAIGASGVLSDRYCIKGNKVLLSPQYMVNCDYNNYACLGGYLSYTWYFLEKTGIPTEQCVKYISTTGYYNVCSTTCDDGSNPTFYKAMYTKSFTSVSAIQLEVMTNGPIEAAMTVYDDFLAYRSGVYKRIYGNSLGGHAVKIVGWGEENGIGYWICANSWGTAWGESGYFKIAFGECGIDLKGIAGVPAI